MKISIIFALAIVLILILAATGYVLFGPEPELPRDSISRNNHLRALETASMVTSSANAYYWETYKQSNGRGVYPQKLTGSLFPGGKIPTKSFGIYSWEYDPGAGTAKVVVSSYGRVRLKIKDMFKKLFTPFIGEQNPSR